MEPRRTGIANAQGRGRPPSREKRKVGAIWGCRHKTTDGNANPENFRPRLAANKEPTHLNWLVACEYRSGKVDQRHPWNQWWFLLPCNSGRNGQSETDYSLRAGGMLRTLIF